jgi:Leucine-rich repeat (LRR) protein
MFASLNLSNCKEIISCSCVRNQLNTLLLPTEAKKLTKLDLRNNQLTSLDVSGCKELIELDCYNNPLSILILPKQESKLVNLSLSNNQLTDLTVFSNCKDLENL